MAKTTKTKNETLTNQIPHYEIDARARAFLPAIQALFETEEGRKKFDEWKAAKKKNK